jgi:cytochrome b6-f complex iron-sulfur subunit
MEENKQAGQNAGVHSTEDTSRRTFLNFLLGGGLVILFGQMIYPLVRYIIPPKMAEPTPTSVVAAKVSDLQPNTGKIFHFGTKAGLLIRTPEGEFRAFNATCTHLQCTVQYDSNGRKIWCACHNGFYDLNGVNVAGPPPRPLESYKVVQKGEDIIVAKRDV